MAFVSQTRMVANAWLRPGNTVDSSGCKAFMEETFNEVLKDKKIGLVRADSGFYSQELLSYLESKHLNYSIATRMYPNVKNAVGGLQDWIALAKGIELNEMTFKHENGKLRRYIIIKKQVELRPKSGGKMLFDDMPGYRYSCYVSNLDLPLDQIWNVYNTRADCENRLKRTKTRFWFRKLLFKRFLGDSSFF